MIRVYFVYEDPFDDAHVNLSFADVPTRDPGTALARIEAAAESGELWRMMYPGGREYPYTLIRNKMSYLDISALVHEASAETTLAI